MNDERIDKMKELCEKLQNIFGCVKWCYNPNIFPTHNLFVDGEEFIFRDSTLEALTVEQIINEIMTIMREHISKNPEYIFENENEQAMLDAAMDYGFV